MESSFRAARDGMGATLWHDGALRPVAEVATAADGPRPAGRPTPARSPRSKRVAARGRRRRPPARGLRPRRDARDAGAPHGRDRHAPLMQAWLKALGHARWQLPDAWLEDADGPRRLQRTGFPRRPRMVPGDRLVYYASVWRVVFAIVEVTDEPEHDRTTSRWPWFVAVEPLLVVPRLTNAPPVEAIGVAARSMSQQSHIRLRDENYDLSVEALGSVGWRSAVPLTGGRHPR